MASHPRLTLRSFYHGFARTRRVPILGSDGFSPPRGTTDPPSNKRAEGSLSSGYCFSVSERPCEAALQDFPEVKMGRVPAVHDTILESAIALDEEDSAYVESATDWRRNGVRRSENVLSQHVRQRARPSPSRRPRPSLLPTTMSHLDDPELSPTSPVEESDTALSHEFDSAGPRPGLNGTPVRWYDADRTESYTRITPFQEKHDTSVEFFYKPVTLSVLGVALTILAYVATTQDVLEEGRDKRRVGAYAAVAGFLLFGVLQFRDGPFIRPHPAFWRLVLGINLLYELALVFLLFQDLNSARSMMKYLDPSLGRPLPEKSYAEHCEFTPRNVWNAIDIFCLAHALGWFGKALILRDYWFCWILSVAFELAEYSLQHQLPNFAECWWDHWILDVLVCNWLGTYLGAFGIELRSMGVRGN
ncbi:hypothetical protein NM688_g8639 [Phlebia brevispora]|uniref:Uncharacterized protein n=1 Tax=Phlebia brevispora TaxID=194682 RepID=A0ACC1RRG3_9APHY|nr:hypothetical protein NM688_g8639 [Phlebia brevispora]